jgi:hypothetical protein
MMKPGDRPKLLLAVAALCLLTTSFLPIFLKTLFVEETGHYTPLAPGVAAALLVAYLFRKDLARNLTLILCTFLSFIFTLLIVITVANDGKYVGLLYLWLLQAVTILILRDRQVKDYVKGNP